MAINGNKGLVSASNILISTDSDLIKSTVFSKGLNVPFKRPKKLSDDFTGTVEVVTHALGGLSQMCARLTMFFDYPTAVLLSSEDIIAAMNTLLEDDEAGL